MIKFIKNMINKSANFGFNLLMIFIIGTALYATVIKHYMSPLSNKINKFFKSYIMR